MTRNDLPALAEISDSGALADQAADASSTPLDYVRELRAEKRSWQLKAKEMEAVAAQARDELRATRTAADARILQAEMKALAVRAGMVDPDGVKLLDLSSVHINAAGEVVGGDDAIAVARTARPWLFANARTGNPERPPRPHDPHETADARRMTEGEYAVARKSRAWRR